MRQTTTDITEILSRWRDGDPHALHELAPLVMQDLRRLAVRYLQGPEAHGIQATDLIHDFYAVVSDDKKRPRQPWRSRRQFFAFAGKAMRNLLISHLRRQGAGKRGGGVVHIPFDDMLTRAHDPEELVRLADAVEDLELIDPLQGRIVDLVFFVGLTQQEAADALEISVFKLRREWRTAKLWLRHALTSD